MFRRFLPTLATIAVLAVAIPATAAAAPVNEVPPYDPPKTPAKHTTEEISQVYWQPNTRWTVYARPYGKVPDGLSLANHQMFANKNIKLSGPLGQPFRYSLFYKTEAECNTQIDPYGYPSGPLPMGPHLIWLVKNDWTEQAAHKCYKIFNGMWVYEYINFLEMPGIKNIDGLPGRYPKDVPPEQRQYQKPY